MVILVFIGYLVVLAYFSDHLMPAMVVGSFGAYGALMVAVSLQRDGVIKRLNQWLRVKGSVLKFSVDRDYGSQNWGGDSNKKLASYDWVPSVVYSYEVQGVCYQSPNMLSSVAGNTAYKKYRAKEYISGYTEVGSVYIHYNPDDHSDAFLVHPDNKNNLLFGLILAVMCAYLVLNNGIG